MKRKGIFRRMLEAIARRMDEQEAILQHRSIAVRKSSTHPYWRDWQLEQHRKNGGCVDCNWGSGLYD